MLETASFRRFCTAVSGLLIVIACAVVCPAPAGAAGDWGDPAYMAVETDRIIDGQTWRPLNMSLSSWTKEILPWFAAEGIVTLERSPTDLRYTTFAGPQANLLLGMADCAQARVSITARFANPVSSVYRSLDMVFTLTHELAHVQQNTLCNRAPAGLVETSAQLMAMEVLAAMALDGNTWAGLSLLRELRAIAVGTLAADANRGLPGADEAYTSVLSTISTNAELARAAERRQSWERTPQLRAECLLDYAERPYHKLVAALHGDLVVSGLATPVTHGRPWASRPTDGTLVVDSLAEFLDRAPSLYRGD